MPTPWVKHGTGWAMGSYKANLGVKIERNKEGKPKQSVPSLLPMAGQKALLNSKEYEVVNGKWTCPALGDTRDSFDASVFDNEALVVVYEPGERP